MLISFSASNYRSIADEVTLNMVASTRLGDHPNHSIAIPNSSERVLRTALIYGPNGAGKSNVVRAMEFAQGCITRGELKGFDPYRFSPPDVNSPTAFEFRVLLDSRVMIYGFDAREGIVESEWLSVVSGEREVDVFTRDAEGNTVVHQSAKRLFPDDPVMFDTLAKLCDLPVQNERLFLARVSELRPQSQGLVLMRLLRWFTDDLVVVSSGFKDTLVDRLASDGEFNLFCAEFLDKVGTGIKQLFVRTFETTNPDLVAKLGESLTVGGRVIMSDADAVWDMRVSPTDPKRIETRWLFAHHPTSANRQGWSLPFREESDGTKAFLRLLPLLSSAQGHGQTVVIDELDRSLHPHLCREFIRFYCESSPGARRQLIVTTHQAHLLDQELLRRDEYWFCEKDTEQKTRLYSLSDFSIRNDLQLQKGYLQGRFGAIPIFGDMKALEQLLAESDRAKSSPTERPVVTDGGLPNATQTAPT